MSELQEFICQTKRKLELLEQIESLESENKILDAEIRKLKIIAHNEQADVENMQRPSMKGLFLSIMGKKQEALEKEQAEARNAQQNYELAAAKQDAVKYKSENCREELTSLAHCEDHLRTLIAYPEDTSFSSLNRCSEKLPEIQDYMTALMTELVNVSKLAAFRNGTASTSALAGTDDRLMTAERRAQDLLTHIKEELRELSENLVPFGMAVDIDEIIQIGDDYLTDIYTPALVTARVDKVTIALRQLRFRLDALKPTLADTIAAYQKESLRSLIAAAEII